MPALLPIIRPVRVSVINAHAVYFAGRAGMSRRVRFEKRARAEAELFHQFTGK